MYIVIQILALNMELYIMIMYNFNCYIKIKIVIGCLFILLTNIHLQNTNSYKNESKKYFFLWNYGFVLVFNLKDSSGREERDRFREAVKIAETHTFSPSYVPELPTNCKRRKPDLWIILGTVSPQSFFFHCYLETLQHLW